MADRRHGIASGLVLGAVAALLLSRWYGHREPVTPLVEIDPIGVVEAGQDFTLHARIAGEDTHPEPVAVHWTSSVDGPLGDGAIVTTHLSPGLHDIRVSVEDRAGRVGEDERRLFVRETPVRR